MALISCRPSSGPGSDEDIVEQVYVYKTKMGWLAILAAEEKSFLDQGVVRGCRKDCRAIRDRDQDFLSTKFYLDLLIALGKALDRLIFYQKNPLKCLFSFKITPLSCMIGYSKHSLIAGLI